MESGLFSRINSSEAIIWRSAQLAFHDSFMCHFAVNAQRDPPDWLHKQKMLGNAADLLRELSQDSVILSESEEKK